MYDRSLELAGLLHTHPSHNCQVEVGYESNENRSETSSKRPCRCTLEMFHCSLAKTVPRKIHMAKLRINSAKQNKGSFLPRSKGLAKKVGYNPNSKKQKGAC